ncbi:hypothetical protein, partial [Klebsiella aerogenes]|uniref:hypothetical protein n=1 Tax=Klebsiella aerogenes TaxID=548 RepID=UPI001952B04A
SLGSSIALAMGSVTNGESNDRKGLNVYRQKEELLFHRSAEIAAPEQIIGIPRCLNMYEELE